jgi:hypothetical protein
MTVADHVRAAVDAAKGDLTKALRLLAASRTREGAAAYAIVADRIRLARPPNWVFGTRIAETIDTLRNWGSH